MPEGNERNRYLVISVRCEVCRVVIPARTLSEHDLKFHGKDLKEGRVKFCSRCRILYPVSAFHRRPDRPSGLQSRCKSCDREIHRLRYKAKRPRKVCGYCERELPLRAFGRRGKGLGSWCKACRCIHAYYTYTSKRKKPELPKLPLGRCSRKECGRICYRIPAEMKVLEGDLFCWQCAREIEFKLDYDRAPNVIVAFAKLPWSSE